MDDWRDPLGDDEETARERARRRAERARRRAEREAAIEAHNRDAVGDDPVVPASTPSGNGDRATAAAGPPQLTSPPAPPSLPSPPPRRPPERPPRSQIYLRRLIAVLGIACLAFAAVVVVVIAQRGNGDEEEAAAPVSGKPQRTFDLTIQEGYDRSQTAALAREAGVEGNYLKASRNAPRGFNLAEYGARGAESLEGFLFPATYELFRSDRAEDLVQKQIEAFEQNFASIDMGYAQSRNLTEYDVVKIASMIEREVAVENERPLVGAVIYNRLSQDMPLQIDATIRFEDQNYDEPLLASRLEEDTPYNTYTNPGLPPGPVGNPGLASLEAAADPARVNYLYYVVKPGTCGHVFTASEAEFFDAQAEYDAAREAEGGQSPTDC
jgi:cell division protein YceG involved in septum cleavage